jgi:hypothetical protein
MLPLESEPLQAHRLLNPKALRHPEGSSVDNMRRAPDPWGKPVEKVPASGADGSASEALGAATSHAALQ